MQKSRGMNWVETARSLLAVCILMLFFFMSSCSEQKTAEVAEPFLVPQNLNFAEHVAPIIHQNCVPCHRKNGAAPFSLIAYQDVAKRAKDIKDVTGRRIMPPWKADPHYVSFKNERVLKENEIKLIHAWVDSGLVAGNTAVLEASLPETASALPKPDLVLKMDKANFIKGDNRENFLLNYIPFELEADQYVKSIEFVGGNRELLHHCTYYFYEVNSSIDLWGNNGPFNVDVNVKHSDSVKTRYKALSRNMSFFGGWIPGAGPVTFPEGIGFRLPKRGILMMTMHYAPSPVDEEDLSYLNIYFHKEPPKRLAKNITMGTGGIGKIYPPLILKAETTSAHKVVVPVNTDVSALSVWPHMHLLGESFKAYALTPSNDTIRLVKIPQWDFNWQSIYYFNNIVRIPKGSLIYIEASYDNTSANINNPFHPPRTVISKGNMATTDEMLTMMMMYLDYQPGDENRAL